MKKTKLYQTLDLLSIHERNDLAKFIASPYFNVNERISSLYSIVDNHLRKNPDEELSRSNVWKQINGSPYSDVKFRKLCSDALKLVEKWLAQKDFESHPYYQNTHLLNTLSQKKITHLYSSSLSKAERDGKQQLAKSSFFHHYNYALFKNKYNLTTEFTKKKLKSFDEQKKDIESLLYNLDLFYITEKLRFYCTILSWKRLTKYDATILLAQEVIQTVENENLIQHPSIGVYYHIMKSMLEPEDTSHYYKIKEYIEQHIDIFPPDEVRDIYDSTVSYCIQRVNKGFFDFQQEVLAIYQSSLQTEALFVDGYLSPTTYRNIVFFALRVGDFVFAQQFCNDYVSKLRHEHQRNAKTFSLARIEMYKKDYSQVINLLQQLDYEDIWYNLNAKTLLIASYYELDEFDALESLLNSFKVFISREKSIPEKRKRNYLNLIRYTNQLIKILPSETSKLKKLYDTVQSESLVSKPWLLTKIKVLLKIT